MSTIRLYIAGSGWTQQVDHGCTSCGKENGFFDMGNGVLGCIYCRNLDVTGNPSIRSEAIELYHEFLTGIVLESRADRFALEVLWPE